MPFVMRPFEAHFASMVTMHGQSTGWEYAAFLESPDGPLLEIVTEKSSTQANPGQPVKAAANNGALVVVHHNHISGESLSSQDWLGLITLQFAETHAHVDDGTHYWGRVLDANAVNAVFAPGKNLDVTVENAFLHSANNRHPPNNNATIDVGFYRKHVIALAMRDRKYVEYEYCWGSNLSSRTSRVQADIKDAVQSILPNI